MNDWGPVGVVLTLVVDVCVAGIVLWVVGLLWQVSLVLGALGCPLVILALLPTVLAGAYVRWTRRPTMVAPLPPVRLPFEQFCDACGSRLVSGLCPYCDGV
jgi:hypothetical protein